MRPKIPDHIFRTGQLFRFSSESEELRFFRRLEPDFQRERDAVRIIEQLQEAVEALQNSLVYPKAATATTLRMELYPYNLASVKTAMKMKEDEE